MLGEPSQEVVHENAMTATCSQQQVDDATMVPLCCVADRCLVSDLTP